MKKDGGWTTERATELVKPMAGDIGMFKGPPPHAEEWTEWPKNFTKDMGNRHLAAWQTRGRGESAVPDLRVGIHGQGAPRTHHDEARTDGGSPGSGARAEWQRAPTLSETFQRTASREETLGGSEAPAILRRPPSATQHEVL